MRLLFVVMSKGMYWGVNLANDNKRICSPQICLTPQSAFPVPSLLRGSTGSNTLFIIKDSTHPFHDLFVVLPSGRRYTLKKMILVFLFNFIN